MHGITAAAVDRKFIPTKIGGCQVWLRSDLGITTVSGGVSLWANQGVAGISGDARQPTAGNQPTFSASGGINGLPKITWDGSNDRLLWDYLGSNDTTSAQTVMVVAKMAANPHSGFTLISMCDAIARYNEMILDLAGYQNCSMAYSNAGGTMRGYASVLDTACHAYIFGFDGIGSVLANASFIGNYDGATQTIAASGAYGGAGQSAIGSRSDGMFALNGDIYEVCAYNRLLSPAEVLALSYYAKLRYSA